MAHIIDLHSAWQQASQQVSLIQRHALKTHRRLYRISVIFVARGTDEAILQSLNTILSQDLVREIIIVSCTTSVSLNNKLYDIAREHPRVFLLFQNPDLSLSKAYNLGLRHSTSKYLLLVSAPYLLPKNIVIKLLAPGLTKPSHWIMGIQSAFYSSFDPFFRFQKNSFYKQGNSILEKERIHHVVSVRPDCLLVSYDMVREMGALDTACDDNNVLLDLCLRVHTAGGDVFGHTALKFSSASLPETKVSLKQLDRLWKSWHHYYQKHFSQSYRKRHACMLYIKLFIKIIAAMIRNPKNPSFC
ncbi:MAG: glycosyltransferase [Candidatus Berkiella sp.]